LLIRKLTGWTKMKKSIILILTLFAILTPYSCEDSSLFFDCDKCYTSIVDKYSIELKVTINSENHFIPITFYRGDIDKGEIIFEDTIESMPYRTELVNFGEHYSAIARYSHNGRTIYAVDGKMLRKKLDESSCSEPCYVISGDILDLRLK